MKYLQANKDTSDEWLIYKLSDTLHSKMKNQVTHMIYKRLFKEVRVITLTSLRWKLSNTLETNK